MVEAVPSAWELPRALRAERHGPFVGRAAALAALERLWRPLASGAAGPRFLVVSGEPGVGKTRVVAEAAAAAAEAGCAVLFGRADEGLDLPFQPIAEAVRGHLEGLDEAARAGLLASAPAELGWLVPELAPAPAADADPESGRFRVVDAAAAHLRALTVVAPVLLVIDDLQWADAMSLRVLRHALAVVDGPLAVVATIRSTDGSSGPVGAALADVWTRTGAERVELEGLEVADVQALAADDTVGAAVHERTAGNPFFVREVLQHLAEGGTPAEPSDLPPTVLDAVRQRLWRLDERTVDILVAAAVIGRELGLDVLAEVVGCSDDEALRALEAGVAARLVHEVEGVVDRFGFDHALVRDALAGELGASRRVRLHARIADALERRPADTPGALADLAAHLLEATDSRLTDRAVSAARRAAAAASARYAFDDAARTLERALERVRAEGVDRPRPDPRTLERDLVLTLELATARAGAGDHEEARAGFLAGAERAAALGRPFELAVAVLGATADRMAVGAVNDTALGLLRSAIAGLTAGPVVDLTAGEGEAAAIALPAGGRAGLLVSLHATLARELLFVDAAEAVAVAHEGVAVARAAGEPRLLVDALGGLHQALLGPGTPGERLAIAEEIAALADASGDVAARRWAHAYRFVDRLGCLDLDGAEADADAAAHLAAEMRPPRYAWWGEALRASVALARGRFDDAAGLVDRAMELGAQSGGQNVEATWATQLFVLRWCQGRLEELAGLFAATSGDAATQTPLWRLAGALAAAETGRVDDAREMVAPLAGCLADLPVDPVRSASVALCGLVALRIGDPALGEEVAALLAAERGTGVVIATGTAFLGAVDSFLGFALVAAGRLDLAVEALEDGEAALVAAGAEAWAVHSRAERALLLRRRGAPGDRQLAAVLADDAAERAAALGMGGVADLLANR